jgi:hypothetical protein
VAPAKLITRRKWTDERGNLYEIVLWRVERNARHPEGVRYRLAFIRAGEEVPTILYDNHHPKGHHRQISGREAPYAFVTARKLVADFLAESRASAGEVK